MNTNVTKLLEDYRAWLEMLDLNTLAIDHFVMNLWYYLNEEH